MFFGRRYFRANFVANFQPSTPKKGSKTLMTPKSNFFLKDLRRSVPELCTGYLYLMTLSTRKKFSTHNPNFPPIFLGLVQKKSFVKNTKRFVLPLPQSSKKSNKFLVMRKKQISKKAVKSQVKFWWDIFEIWTYAIGST